MKTPQRYIWTDREMCEADSTEDVHRRKWVDEDDFVVALQEATKGMHHMSSCRGKQHDRSKCPSVKIAETGLKQDGWISPTDLEWKIAQLKQYANQERSNKLIHEVFGK